MVDNFKDVTETLQNRFAESPLGKQLEGMNFDNIDNTDDSSLEAYVSDIPDELCDDNGNIYSVDGKLQPNTTYELNGNVYTTDENGRIISCEAKPIRSPENPRDNEAQRQVGGDSRQANDQGGHVVGRDMNGDGGIGNLIAMDSRINQSDYKRMENDIKTALDDGKDVTMKVEITYNDDSDRPDRITVIVTADGQKTVYKFDNNIDGSLRNEVPEGAEEKDAEEGDEYFSSYDERLQQTPKEGGERGEWDGERGESKFIPYDQEIKEILAEYGLDGVVYKDGIPDFSEVSESTVEIDNMTENRADNFRQCDQKAAEQWNKEARDGRTDWTARDVAQWRKENGYSWHERNDMKTCDLVPTKINDYFGHLGGVSECRKRDAADNDGGDFDE